MFKATLATEPQQVPSFSLTLSHGFRYKKVEKHIRETGTISQNHKLLIGACFSGEYSLESAALFNPSIVPHPDQKGVPKGGLRFIMSLRATGEGHISSIEFRAGTILPSGKIEMDAISHYVTQPEVIRDPAYHKPSFLLKLKEMGLQSNFVLKALSNLGECLRF